LNKGVKFTIRVLYSVGSGWDGCPGTPFHPPLSRSKRPVRMAGAITESYHKSFRRCNGGPAGMAIKGPMC